MGLRELLQSMDDDYEAHPMPLPEAQVATLKEVFARYTTACPYKAGDLVTPRAGTATVNVGTPHIVLETRKTEPDFDSAEFGSNKYGARIDMRVAGLNGCGDLCMWWVESVNFEPYSIPSADTAPAAA